jgi:phage-related minor tail protein
MTEIDGITVAIGADTSAFKREIAAADKLARNFGASINAALTGAIVYGRNFNDVLSALGLRLSALALNAALKPLEQSIGTAFQNLFMDRNELVSSATNVPYFAKPVAKPFANGGVISAPSYFPIGSGIGLAGERGAEAIMPLARGADGKLGVTAQTQAAPISVTVNVSTPDAASFRRSESYLSGVIARAVARGDRSL